MSSFREYTLLPSLLSTLQNLDFITPTEIQAKALPALLRGESVVGVAETGSGKTLAYALPALHKVKQLEDEGDAVSESGRPRAIVLVPSSDLGEQVTKVFKDFTHDTRIRVRSALGGIKMAVARRNVSGPFEILLATPGRLEQLMQLKLINLSDLRLLVLDEADQMLDAGFRPAIQRFLKSSPADLQLALFTATASEKVQALIQELFSKATHIETGPSSSRFILRRQFSRARRKPLSRSRGNPRRTGRRQCTALHQHLRTMRCSRRRTEGERL